MRLAWLGALALAAVVAARVFSRRRTLDLERKVVVVADGASGLGHELARAFADRGAYIAFSGDDGARVAAVTKELRLRGHDAIGVACDVRSLHDARELVDAALVRWGRLDVVFEEVRPTPLALAARAAGHEQGRTPLFIDARGTARKLLRSMYNRR
jgi:NAD(P)-dependent dehydrogenase (short-subunit alcohol dehydrogenase family)